MGLASSYGPCGCCMTKLMESGKIITYVRCMEHYVSEDDVIVLEAAKNRREYEDKMWNEANKFFNRG